MYDLSILIPALKEEWLKRTVEDILQNKRGNTEVIVGMDGAWSDPPLDDHKDVRIIYSKNLGQRGMTNLLCKLSTAKYVAKTDAHCAFDEGFDVKLMDAMRDDWTIVPVMRNLHVFNWKCVLCGNETYQGAMPQGCSNCDATDADSFSKVLVWKAKNSPNSSAYKFTPDRLQFKYFGSLKEKQRRHKREWGAVAETMSLQGSFFMLTREKYWELNICDASWGGWGQQGTEVALKTWLSGGRVVCNLDTWYAHMFRTQDGFAFPWNGNGISQGRQQQKAREKSLELFKENKWPLQVRPLSWLVEKFWEELQQEPHTAEDPKWTQANLDELKQFDSAVTRQPPTEVTKGIVYCTDNQLNLKIARAVQKKLKTIGLPIVSASLKPMTFGTNVVLPGPRGYLSYFQQIVAALEASTADIIYFCEHDVLYHPSHFDFTPPRKDTFYYNQSWWKVKKDGTAVHWDADQVSGLCAYREVLLTYYRERLATFGSKKFDRKFEPMSGHGSVSWKSPYPNIDIRHEKNLTLDKWSLADFRKKDTAANFEQSTIDLIPGWSGDSLRDILGT